MSNEYGDERNHGIFFVTQRKPQIYGKLDNLMSEDVRNHTLTPNLSVKIGFGLITRQPDV